MKRLLAALVLCTALPAAAQQLPAPEQQRQPPPGRNFFEGMVHYGKWLTGASVIVFTTMGAVEHETSQESYDQLLTICRADNSRCVTGPDGFYTDPTAERLYQQTLYYDQRARRRILLAQAAVVVTGALFLLDLGSGDSGPSDIPFDPQMALTPAGPEARLGLRFAF